MRSELGVIIAGYQKFALPAAAAFTEVCNCLLLH
jgi:hypothetical protein